jgi:hypothetical protein
MWGGGDLRGGRGSISLLVKLGEGVDFKDNLKCNDFMISKSYDYMFVQHLNICISAFQNTFEKFSLSFR